MSDQLATTNYAEVLQQAAVGLFIETDDPERKAWLLAKMAKTPQHVAVPAFRGHLLDYDFARAAQACRVPTGYIAPSNPTEGPYFTTIFTHPRSRLGRFWTVIVFVVRNFNNIWRMGTGFDSHRPLEKLFWGRSAVPCTKRAFMDDVEASGIRSEREADSPVCWKQWKCEQEMERLE